MTETNDDLLTLTDCIRIIRKHLLMIVLTLVICEALAIGLVMKVPRKYKSSALLNLQATYFEIPTVGDSIVGSRDYSEMQAQKQALMRLAINDAFLDLEGEKYGLFKSEPGSAARIGDREGLRKAIDFFSSTTTTFQITAIGKTSEIAFGLASDSLDQIVSVLVNERQRNIMSYRDSLRKQLGSLGVATSANEGETSGTNPQVLKEELVRLENSLKTLQAQYTPNHPTVMAMKQRVQNAKVHLARLKEQGDSRPSTEAPLTIIHQAKGRRTEFGEELLKKINYLDIALEIETNKKNLPYLEILERPVKPVFYFFPKVNAFAIGGLLAGFFMATILVAFMELRKATQITPSSAANQLGMSHLGSLPAMLRLSGRKKP